MGRVVMAKVVLKNKVLREIMAEFKELSSQTVRIGIQSKEKDSTGKQSLAKVAAQNEFGNPQKRIPSRPFMRQAFDKNVTKISEMGKKLAGLLMKRKMKSQQALELWGQEMETNIKNEIIRGDFVPNAPYTIAKKKSDKPLIDTGRMLGSVRYVVKKRRTRGGGT